MSDPSVAAEIAELREQLADSKLLTYRCVHELQGPLATIAGFLKELPASARSGRWSDFDADYERLTRLVELQRQRIDGVLQILRREDRSEAPQPLDVRVLVCEVLADIEAQWPTKRIMVTIDQGWPDVMGRANDIREVLQNLLENAVKFAADQDYLVDSEMTFEREGDHLVIRFRDYGAGIPPSERDRVFEPFVRLEPAQPGSGLGLYLVKRIIAAHGGHVWIEAPASGPGTVVCFTLPVAD